MAPAPVANTDDFKMFVRNAVRAKLLAIPPIAVIDKLDPNGTHVVHRQMIHGDGDFVRTWWYVKLVDNPPDKLVSVVFDMRLEDYNTLPRIEMHDDGEWAVV